MNYLGDEFALFVEAQVASGGGCPDLHFASPSGRNQNDVGCNAITTIIDLIK